MKNVLKIIAGALLFGVIAGGVIFGITKLTGTSLGKSQAQTEETTAVQVPETQVQAGENTQADTETGSTIDTVNRMEPAGTLVAMDVSDIVEEAMPSIVAITNTTIIKQYGYNSIWDYYNGRGQVQEYEQQASGSGVIIKETADELLIATNNHMVEGTESIAVTFCDSETVEAYVKGSDADNDIAVIAVKMEDLKAETKAAIKVAVLHTERNLKPGQYVIVIGNSLGLGQTVTAGVISAVDRDASADSNEKAFDGVIQTDAAINGGNSGGALLNTKGEVIGINMGKYARTDIEGVCFSIPIYKVIDLIEEFSNAKTKVAIPDKDQGRLGIYMNTVSAEQSQALNLPQGVIIVGFSDEKMAGTDYEVEYSPAREAGLQKNDIITKFDGQTVKDANALAELVKYYEAGTMVDVTVQRINKGEYEEKVFTIKLAPRKVTETEEKDEKQDEEKAPEKNDGKSEEKPQDKDNKPSDSDDMYQKFKEFLEQYR
ncbi:MAG: trypsin-like peptidase domain-containing protein [Eubacteriales bacterium]|nr:trypsin-like peptidase domain-containing protein [Eubacteriales bacterium]